MVHETRAEGGIKSWTHSTLAVEWGTKGGLMTQRATVLREWLLRSDRTALLVAPAGIAEEVQVAGLRGDETEDGEVGLSLAWGPSTPTTWSGSSGRELH